MVLCCVRLLFPQEWRALAMGKNQSVWSLTVARFQLQWRCPTRPTLEISELWNSVILDRCSIPGTASCHVQTGSEAHRPYYTAATDANGGRSEKSPTVLQIELRLGCMRFYVYSRCARSCCRTSGEPQFHLYLRPTISGQRQGSLTYSESFGLLSRTH
jgi:hypothetical protein